MRRPHLLAGRRPRTRVDATHPLGHPWHVVTRDWARLGRKVRSRRIALGYKRQADLAAAGGPAERTISSLETGNAIKDWQLARLDHVLRWAPGGCEAILAGGEAVELGERRSIVPDQESIEEAADRLIRMTPADFVKRFRHLELSMEPGQADRWLVRALAAREDYVREQVIAETKRDVS